ncbi:MAG: hypothetical protein MUD08_11870, partial [Cytophagales bacterium]|nr:hypothetical protein [Cytophagales bacterium]
LTLNLILSLSIMKNLFAIAAIVLATVSFSACGGAKEEGAGTDTTSTMSEPTMDSVTVDTGSTMAPVDTMAGDSAK